jgi:hypothetical protein
MTAIRIRDLRYDEADLAANFFHEQWRRDHVFYRNRELMLWAFHDSPYTKLFCDGLSFKAAFDSDTVVGVCGYTPLAFNRYGERQYGCYLSNWWVHPDYRRGPLSMGLIYQIQRGTGIDACIGGLMTPVAERVWRELGYAVLPLMPRLVCVLDVQQLAGLLDPGAGGCLGAVEERLQAQRRSQALKVDPSIEVTDLRSFDSLGQHNWDDFYWHRVAFSHLGPARETNYLVWRYQGMPGFHYEALLARRQGAVCGLVIYRREAVKDRREIVVRIVDLVAEREAVPSLMSATIERAANCGAVMIDYFYTGSLYQSVLESCGFIDARDVGGDRYWVPFLFQPLDHCRRPFNCWWWVKGLDLQSPTLLSDFYMTKGDYEFDRPN